jgi:hypothetical protein
MKLIDVASYHIGVAAEAITAGLFARCGYDVSVQYGANQPEYDLMIAKGPRLLKVSVKGTKEADWGLTQGHLKNADYQKAADDWLKAHSERTIYSLVLFYSDKPAVMPRVYLATPGEVAERLKATAKGRGDTILHEKKVWTERAHGAGTIEKIPSFWKFSSARIEHLMKSA